DWRPPELTEALKTADDVWFELPIDPATEAETLRLATQQGLQSPDESLFKGLSGSCAQRVLRVAKSYGADPAPLARLRPWLAEVMLGGAAFRKAGAEGQEGVEKAIAAAAPPTAKRRAFETAAEQIDILSGGPPSEQNASLCETAKEMEDTPDEF